MFWAIQNRKALWTLSKISKAFVYRDGYFTYTSARMFSPADAKFIDNIRPNYDIVITDDNGRVNISGWAGGYSGSSS